MAWAFLSKDFFMLVIFIFMTCHGYPIIFVLYNYRFIFTRLRQRGMANFGGVYLGTNESHVQLWSACNMTRNLTGIF